MDKKEKKEKKRREGKGREETREDREEFSTTKCLKSDRFGPVHSIYILLCHSTIYSAIFFSLLFCCLISSHYLPLPCDILWRTKEE